MVAVLDIDVVGTVTMSQAALKYLREGGIGKPPSEVGVILNLSATIQYSAFWRRRRRMVVTVGLHMPNTNYLHKASFAGFSHGINIKCSSHKFYAVVYKVWLDS